MIENPAIERFCSRREPPRRPQVRFARARVAARVVVSEQDAGASVPCRVDDDGAQREVDAADMTVVPRDVQAASFIVDMRDPQAFAAGILVDEAARKEFAHRGEAIELQREFGTLIPHGRFVAWNGVLNDANRLGFGA
jgi:hypothetical protein